MKKILSNSMFRRVASSTLVLVIIIGFFACLYSYAHDSEETDGTLPSEFAEYDRGTVTDILTDNCAESEVAEGAYRGEQTLIVELTSGRHKGDTVMATNSVGPLYGVPAEVGDSVILIVNNYSSGDIRCTVYEHDRSPAIFMIVAAFILVTVLIGGRTGAKSILGLILTIAVLLAVFLPLLLKGWEPISTSFMLCSLVAIACFVILGGCSRKVLCACIGTVGGMALAMVFGIVAQKLLKLDGLRAEYAEALLQLRQTGTPVHIRGLLVAGVIISALGAVMDVAMSISSAQSELKAVNPSLTAKDLWHSGMNIGRDMVGTMTNTLILAILGSSTILILYLYSLGLTWHQLMSSSYIAIETIGSVSSAIGVILAVPLTNLAGSLIYSYQGKNKETKA